jgi:hypothetical protein
MKQVFFFLTIPCALMQSNLTSLSSLCFHSCPRQLPDLHCVHRLFITHLHAHAYVSSAARSIGDRSGAAAAVDCV